MIFRILCLLSLFSTCLSGQEYRIIRLKQFHDVGMFATANQVLGQLYLYETDQLANVSGLTVDFGTYGLYFDPRYGVNWWSYYFEPVEAGTKNGAKMVYSTKQECQDAWEARRLVTREVAGYLVKKYIHIKPHIQQKIDAFVSENFHNLFTIGIHYRGTDKSQEAPRVSYEDAFEIINQHLPKNAPYVLFIATDESEFLEEAQKRYPNQVVALDATRSHIGGKGIHFIHKNRYAVGEEALMDAALLARCDLLIRTSSNLSLWSTYFNPDLPVVLLNQRHRQAVEPE